MLPWNPGAIWCGLGAKTVAMLPWRLLTTLPLLLYLVHGQAALLAKKAVSSEVNSYQCKRFRWVISKFSGKIKGKIVMFYSPRYVCTLHFRLMGNVMLILLWKNGRRKNLMQPRGPRNFTPTDAMRQRQALARQMGDFYNKEKPALVLSLNARGYRRNFVCTEWRLLCKICRKIIMPGQCYPVMIFKDTTALVMAGQK